ncbi:MAG TPA: S49 family peptidase, partial [Azospirillaceae bacterium]|nr:S49 family peptidase [Azospirillaceae bacterium]
MRHVTPRLLGSLLNRPQLIEPAAGAAVLAVLQPGARLDGYDGDAANDCRDPREYHMAGSTAIIPVVGELVFRGMRLQPASGCCSYQAIGDNLAMAMADPAVERVVFDIDSPGGMADGCFDLARRIAAFRGVKPMTAAINVRATSAAYAIAAAADRVVIGRNGFAGSIGVVAYHTDISQALADAGVKVTYFHAGARKIDGAPALPISKDAAAIIQTRIDQLHGDFCALVAELRGLSVAAVKAMEAAIYMGPEAIDAGLADDIQTLEDILTVPATQAPPAGATAADALAVVSACTKAGHPALAEQFLKAGLSLAVVGERLTAVGDIVESCAKAGVPGMATSMAAAVAGGL